MSLVERAAFFGELSTKWIRVRVASDSEKMVVTSRDRFRRGRDDQVDQKTDQLRQREAARSHFTSSHDSRRLHMSTWCEVLIKKRQANERKTTARECQRKAKARKNIGVEHWRASC